MNRKNFKRISVVLTALVVVAVGFTSMVSSKHTALSPDDTNHLVGTWTGETKPIVQWVNEKSIPVTLVIQPSGEITGMLGDATVINGIVKNRQNTITGKLFRHQGFVISVNLRGNIINSEQIRRDAASIFFVDYKNEEWHGSINSSGSKVGDKTTMILTTRDMVLRKNKSNSLER